MLNLHNLFSIELLYAVFITPISFINWAIYYCIDECGVGKFLLISIMGVIIIYTLLGSVLSYSILYGLKKFFYKEISKTGLYPNYLNILIRLIPLGYTITSIHTIISGKGFWRGLVQEIIYTLGVSAIYIIGYISSYYIYIIG